MFSFFKNREDPKKQFDYAGGDYETLGPVSLVSLLREGDSDSNGIDEIINQAHQLFYISQEKMESIVEASFGKAKDLARMIV